MVEATVKPEAAMEPARLAIRLRKTVADYVSLTKPRIVALLVITEFGGLVAAARGIPSFQLLFFSLLGGAMAAGGAAAVNCWYDRDIDAVMSRTCTRPIPSGRIDSNKALAFGVGLGLTGVVLLALTTTPLAAMLALAGGLFYVFVYTLWLKRSSRANIVIGGAAGAFPPLVGWAAVTGRISWLAVSLFAVIFFWTPPHFWALALLLKTQYRQARLPMLPSVVGEASTRRQIVGYSFVLVLSSIVPGFWLGTLYTAAALLLGWVFLWFALGAYRTRGLRWAGQLFHYSLAYLALLFVLVAATSAVRLPTVASTGKPAPDFTAQTISGSSIRLADLRGKPVIVTFWATWCAACQDEFPMIERARAAYASQGVTILAVNYEQTDRPALQAFLQRLGTHFDALLDPNGAIAQQYGVDVGLPVTVFIDRSGMVSAIKVGAMTPEYVSTQLRGIL